MKNLIHSNSKSQPHAGVHHPRRGGAVIIMVVALTTTLVIVGLFAFSFSNQEKEIAENFASLKPIETDPDPIFDWGLGQLIVSTPADAENSALFSRRIPPGGGNPGAPVSRYSLLANKIGLIDANGRAVFDVAPGNGAGLRVNWNPGTAQFQIDYDGDGNLDALNRDQDTDSNPPPRTNDFIINLSRAGSYRFADPGDNPNGLDPITLGMLPLAQEWRPDAGYNYPDLNSLFLAVDETRLDSSNGSQRIVKPSFMPLAMNLEWVTANAGKNLSQLYFDNETGNQVLRPHREHMVDADPSPANFDPLPRFIQRVGGTLAQSGDRNRLIEPFDNFDAPIPREFGRWNTMTDNYQFDVDNDGDGVLDSIWMDLDHPIINLPNGRQVMPLFAFKVIDGDGLLNLNTHGNAALMRFLGDYRNQLQDQGIGANSYTPDPLDVVHKQGASNDAAPYDINTWVSQSNLGVSPSEVNVGVALYADPGTNAVPNQNFIEPGNARNRALSQHRYFYGNANLNFTRLQMANTELFFLLSGRPQYSSPGTLAGPPPNGLSASSGALIAGRYGETLRLFQAAFNRNGPYPQAGVTSQDDDFDSNRRITATPSQVDQIDFSNVMGGAGYLDELFQGRVTIPPISHPIDYSGLGQFVIDDGAGNGAVRDRNGVTNNDMNNPTYWPQYPVTDLGGFGVDAAINPTPNGNFNFVTFWNSQFGGYQNAGMPNAGFPGYALQRSPVSMTQRFHLDQLRDEPDEMVLNQAYPSSADSPFPASEIAALHLSDTDRVNSQFPSRVLDLAPFNFKENRRAAEIRSQFTTESWDRLETSLPRTFDARGDREFSNGNRFPPAYANASRHEGTNVPPSPGDAPVNNANDPFRPVLRRLLATQSTFAGHRNIDADRFLPQHKLNINRLLVNFDRDGNPIYRNLTPHAQFTEADDGVVTVPMMVHDNPTYVSNFYDTSQSPVVLTELDPAPTGAPGLNTVNESTAAGRQAQEWWARYDRQRLARDIFMLLYTVGTPENVDPTLGNANYQPLDMFNDLNSNNIHDRIEEMAQFAVNYVDALDRDDVITRFEYDPDPSDGWQIMNNVIDTDGDGTPDSPAFANGIEEQTLTISEALWIFTDPMLDPNDSSTTPYDDTEETQFLFIELRNASAYEVFFNTGDWRIVREEIGTNVVERSVEIREDATGALPILSVPSGENFIIGCQDGSVETGGIVRPSDFYIDHTNSTEMELVVPSDNAGTPQTIPDATALPPTTPLACDLDLAWQDHVNAYTQNWMRGANAGTRTLVGVDTPPDAVTEFELVLQRRRSLGVFGVGSPAASDWIEVDRIVVEYDDKFGNVGTQADALTAIQGDGLRSKERTQPLSRDEALYPSGMMIKHSIDYGAEKHNGNERWTSTLGAGNFEFSLWQPHFDRDFTSVYDLLSIPRFAPERTTEMIGLPQNDAPTSPSRPSSARPGVGVAKNSMTPETTAGYLFLNPDIPLHGDPSMPITGMQNRWYRLFEFIEVPTRSEQTVKDDLDLIRRTPGKINLNTIRHPHVLAALIDDEYHHDPLSQTPLAGQTQGLLRPTLDRIDGTNRDWYERLQAERDGPPPAGRPISLPGHPSARPFRPLSYVDPFVAGESLQHTIMRRMLNSSDSSVRQLGLFEARTRADTTNNEIDYDTRHRILKKISNNTTVRSNIFAIWLTVGFFESHEVAPGAVQIGARAEDVRPVRMFCVVDMSKIEEAYNDPDPTDGVAGSFDFRKFIIHRQLLP